MVRIRYFRNELNQVTSKPMLVVNEQLTAVVNLADFSYALVANDGTSRIEGTANSLPEAQKKLKHELKALGMVFNDEVRERREAEEPTKSDIVKRVAEANNIPVTDLPLSQNVKPSDFIGQATDDDSGLSYAEVTS